MICLFFSDVRVTCIFSEECVLPCTFTHTGGELSVQWFQQDSLILSLQHTGNILNNGNLQFLSDDVSKGNASVRLSNVDTRSKGRYRCVVNNVTQLYVAATVEAPIRSISMVRSELSGLINCSTREVYPAPVLQWSSEPRVPAGILQPITRITPARKGLFTVESVLKQLNYSKLNISPGQTLVIPCRAPKHLQSQSFSVLWTFSRENQTTDVLGYDSWSHTSRKVWDQAELKGDEALKGDLSLNLKKPTASEHTGIYTCEVSGGKTRHLIQTRVKIPDGKPGEASLKYHLWMLGIVAGLIALLAGVLIIKRYRAKTAEDVEAGSNLLPEASAKHSVAEVKKDESAMESRGFCAALLLLLRTCVSGITTTKDAHVTCLFMEDCVLPCSFRPTGAVVIHWYKQQIPVHSYYYNQDQYGLQNKHFSGRTGLFSSQIALGNASLVLRRVKVQDQGRYKCYTSTRKGNQETFVNLGVKALIQSVKLEMVEEKIICVSQNIYPAPELTWSTDPPTDTRNLQNQTRRSSDTRGLFSVESSIGLMGNVSQHVYFCSLLSADGLQVWTASLHQQDELFAEEGSAFLVPCIIPHPWRNFTLTWTFIRSAESLIIFTYDSRSRRMVNLWEGRAEVDVELAHVGNASLHLLNPESQTHSGFYICTLHSFQVRHQVQTHLNVTLRVPDDDEYDCRRSWWGTAASVFIFLVTVSVALSRCLTLKEMLLPDRQAQDEPRRKVLESAKTEIHRVTSITKQKLSEDPDHILPHSPIENSITDSFTPDRPQTPTSAILTLLTTDEKENERNELEPESAERAEMEIVIHTFYTTFENATPELTQINGFR
ncbi:hypothetical protein DNTS_026335 [Danionella cerebrum]|uniref:Ig-like domain-containing protein n=1 Tax=Danionella cerebrum TaxID=2873325 RepID=A0A553QX59_9TELE|nr:hypothetical protein DNTS_026335 [Danionella translucida]